MGNAAKAVVCVCISVLCLALSAQSVTAQGHDVLAKAPTPKITIKAVEIRGNKRVDRSTILFYLKLKKDQSYGNTELIEQIRKDVRAIYGLGFFRDVRSDVESFEGGLRVIFVVKEKPTIRKIEYEGNVSVEEEKIREQTTIKVQTIVNEATIKATVRNIRRLYQEQGHYFARVEAVLKEGTRNTVDVALRIHEGESVQIETITFRGNESISRKDLLDVMATTEGGFWSFITESGIFKEDELEKDLLRIRILYRTRGYFKAQVGQPIVKKDRARGKLNVIIPISEGFQYKVGQLEIRGGEDVVPPEELRKSFLLFSGDIFNQTKMFGDVRSITDSFAARGYAFVDVKPNSTPDDAKKTVSVVYDIKKGRRVYIGRISVKGNTRTRENVVRREIRVTEGALYDSKGLTKTRRLLGRTGYFGSVKVDEKRRVGSDDILDIDINVKEKPTGIIGMGIGFNNQDGIILSASIRENNLFGRGYQAALNGSFSGSNQQFVASFTNPNFMDKDFSVGGDVFVAEEEFVTFNNKREGGRINLGKSLTDELSTFLTYELSNSRVTNVSPVAAQSIINIKNEKLVQSQLSPALVYDSRDRRLLPTKGTYSRVSPAISGGPLGGDIDVYFYQTDFRKYYNVGEKFRLRLLKKLIWSYRVEGRYIDSFKGTLPAFRRLFLTGRRALRGFDRDELGPRDRAGEAIGGNSTLLMSTQLRHPFFGPTQVVGFLDAGNVWSRSDAFNMNDLRWGAGFGVRVVTPLGPFRLDIGYKLDKKSGERPREVHLGIGTSF